MDLSYAAIALLACMVFVLSGMVGYIYWQQTKVLQNLQSLAIYVTREFTPPQQPQPEAEPPPEESTQEATIPDEKEEDDRLSVKEEESVLHVTGPKDIDIDDLQGKTASQLRDLLSQKGIPFGKRDSKTVLIELLKATA